MENKLSKTYFEAATDASDCKDCYFREHFIEWIKIEVLNLRRRG